MSTKNTKDSTLSKYFLPYDIYERHKFVGSLIENGQTVVDIGGELNLLSQFCRPAEIIVANLTSGDIIIKKNKQLIKWQEHLQLGIFIFLRGLFIKNIGSLLTIIP